jgi:hypothetical protein
VFVDASLAGNCAGRELLEYLISVICSTDEVGDTDNEEEDELGVSRDVADVDDVETVGTEEAVLPIDDELAGVLVEGNAEFDVSVAKKVVTFASPVFS